MSYRDEIEEKLTTRPESLSPGCGCMIWIVGLLASTFILAWIDIYLFGVRIFGPPTLWESVRDNLIIFGPQAVFILFIIIRWRRSRRPALPGICANCGYDLRATPTRCPECGKEVAKNP